MSKKRLHKHKRRVPFIEQMQQTECALCCLAMVSSFYYKELSLYELRERMGNSRDGTSLFHLKKVAEQIGFESKGFRLPSSNLTEIPLPAVLFWGENHYVVLEKIDHGKFQIVDPGSGRRTLSKEDFEKQYTGYALTLVPKERFEHKKIDSVWKNFSSLITNRLKIFTTILILTLALQIFSVLMPFIIQFTIDDIIVPQNTDLLKYFILLIIFMVLFQTIFYYFRGKILIRLHNELDYQLQTDFFKHILKVPYQFFLLRSFGDLIFRASSMKIIRDQVANQIVKGFLDSIILIGLFLYMVIQSPILALITLVCAFANIAIVLISQRLLSEKNQIEIKEQSETQGIQTEILYGIFSVKTSGVEKNIYARWLGKFNRLLQAYREKGVVLNKVNTSANFLQYLSPLLILFIGAQQLLSGHITLGILVAFQSISGQFFSLTSGVVQIVNSFILTKSYLTRVEDVFDAPVEDNGGKIKKVLKGDIRLENVSYSYSKYSPKVVEDINVEIKKGQKVAFIGKSGSGKTTLANIITGLLKPDNGTVYYDDISTEYLDLTNIRKQIGIVPQTASLFNRTILENIKLHNTEASMQDVIEAAKVAQIHDEIMQMPMKYNTVISEMGMNISGGQRQRIVLAKALLNKPSILILDEATSSLDHVNESKIDNYLSEINCTRIIIAHRLTTVMNCDLIVVLDNGKIIDVGNHQQLIERSGFYSQYYREMIS
ncbi:peptidase domain-containing ABC transporter [Ureibacillus aquaedulcis]|uniref:Peptidase domain-containing ABC transporter n=1 Tax=Ureibacillus aquaedulcis TaxID=3058421 RepID=A0ABT8GVT6_9BACL|nr:peptidase domain-containing ABC transporter [Ureibacillus sp. BA0131]MDN4495533.1 peptidase domain-containing ABC transporter [Ureibacillus sp. BA0131]